MALPVADRLLLYLPANRLTAQGVWQAGLPANRLEPIVRLELTTFPLRRDCSTN